MSGVELYKRLLVYALPYRWVFVAGVIGMVAVAVSEASFAALLKPIMDGGFVERDPSTIRLTPLLLIGAFLVRGIGSFADQYSIAWIGRRVVFDLRAEMFKRMIHFPARYYDHHSSATLVAKLIYDVEQVSLATTMAVRVLIKDSLLTVVLLGWLAFELPVKKYSCQLGEFPMYPRKPSKDIEFLKLLVDTSRKFRDSRKPICRIEGRQSARQRSRQPVYLCYYYS